MISHAFRWVGVGVLVLAFATLATPERGSAADDLCGYLISTTVNGTVATGEFKIVRANCQVSLVSISKFSDGNAIFDSATGTFAPGQSGPAYYNLTVNMPCDINSETDGVLGPPALYPPGDLDLGARSWHVACPTGGGGGSSSGGGGGGGGGGEGGGGGTPPPPPPPPPPAGTPLPDLATTIVASKTKGLRIGDPVTVTVTVKNNGKAPAGGAHVLITPSLNLILNGKPTASRGAGCSGTAVIDCDLGSLSVGASATVRLQLRAASGKRLFVGATAQRSVADAAPADDTGKLVIPLVPRTVRFSLAASAARIADGQQFAFLKLSARARVTAQIYVSGVARPIVWRRTLAAGTSGVRIALPKLAKGQRFSIVFRATAGTAKASTKLALKV